MIEMIAWLAGVDKAVFIFINMTIANPVTDFIMPIVTLDLHLKIFYVVCIGGLLWRGDRRLRFAVIFSIITLTLTDQIASSIVKPLFERTRPCWDMDVHLLVRCGAGFSMPSSHAANLFGQAYLFKKIAPSSAKFLIPFAILVALSRVFVGVHYPADIIIGAALGTLVGYGMGYLFLKIKYFRNTNVSENESSSNLSEI
jgi:membrane-associated phospholipid phosphatase